MNSLPSQILNRYAAFKTHTTSIIMTDNTENEEIKPETETKTTTTFEKDFKKEIPALLAELSFFVLPFIVILIIDLTKCEWIKLIQTADWAIASALLFGQTIVKLIMGVASREQSFPHQIYGLLTALIIVLGLVPSITILTIFQIYSHLSTALIIAQFVLLGLAITVFLYFGTIGQVLSANSFRYKIGKKLGLNK